MRMMTTCLAAKLFLVMIIAPPVMIIAPSPASAKKCCWVNPPDCLKRQIHCRKGRSNRGCVFVTNRCDIGYDVEVSWTTGFPDRCGNVRGILEPGYRGDYTSTSSICRYDGIGVNCCGNCAKEKCLTVEKEAPVVEMVAPVPTKP